MFRFLYENQGTKENIKCTFLDIYINKPLREIKVSDLIITCGISRGTFYFHFQDIYALYHECEKDLLECLEENISDVILSTVVRDFDKYVREVSNIYIRYIEHIDMLRCFLTGSEEASFRQLWFDSLYCKFEKTMEFSSTLSLAKQKNLIRFFAGGHLAIFSNWVLNDCSEPVEDIAYISAQAMFKGLFLENSKKIV